MSIKDVFKGTALWVIIPVATGLVGFFGLGPVLGKYAHPDSEQVKDAPAVVAEDSAPEPALLGNKGAAPSMGNSASSGIAPEGFSASGKSIPDVKVSVERATSAHRRRRAVSPDEAQADTASPSIDTTGDALTSDPNDPQAPAAKPKKKRKKKPTPPKDESPAHEPAAGERADPASGAGAGVDGPG